MTLLLTTAGTKETQGKKTPRAKQGTLLNIILSRVLVIIERFGLVIGFIDHLQVVTTNNYYTIADFRTKNHTTLSLLSIFPLVFTW
jgi:hypothetical protein